jgi:deazaflavin-dependent oxidoreductase (nitroreductase family)
MTSWNDNIIKEFRENNGKAGGRFEGAHLLLLTTTGRKSGEKRIAPMMYFSEPDGIYVIASKGGSPEHPAWYHNLTTHPEVTVEQGTDRGIETYEATAIPVEGQKRDELWAKFSSRVPGFAGYQEKTDRVIPIVAIRPRESAK